MRVTFSGVVDWSPALVGLWADYEAIGIAPRRRRWNLSMRARDRTVTRNGAVDPRDGRSIAADLWQAWASTASIPFEDVDFPATGTTYNVRVASIREEIPVPNDASQWGDSVVSLELVET
jgi:hypothetical protein